MRKEEREEGMGEGQIKVYNLYTFNVYVYVYNIRCVVTTENNSV